MARRRLGQFKTKIQIFVLRREALVAKYSTPISNYYWLQTLLNQLDNIMNDFLYQLSKIKGRWTYIRGLTYYWNGIFLFLFYRHEKYQTVNFDLVIAQYRWKYSNGNNNAREYNIFRPFLYKNCNELLKNCIEPGFRLAFYMSLVLFQLPLYN